MGDKGMPTRSLYLRTLALALVLALIAPMAPLAAAQEPAPAPPASQPPTTAPRVTPTMQDYSKPRSHFPFILTPYAGRDVPEPVFANTPRIDQLMKDGTLYLSLTDAIALALENNLDLAIARYNLS